jgi:hypothetical protein
MARWQLGFVPNSEAQAAPDAAATPPESARATHDAANRSRHHDDPLDLTPEEIENGCVMPLWPRIKHIKCGMAQALPHINMARRLAQDPRAPMIAMKGFACLHYCHRPWPEDEHGNSSPPMFPIEGDLRGRPGEWIWLDTHGRDTPIKVGHIPAGRTVLHPGPTLGQLMDQALTIVTKPGGG